MASVKYLLNMAIEHIKYSLLKNPHSIFPPPTWLFFPYKANNFSRLIREKDSLYLILFFFFFSFYHLQMFEFCFSPWKIFFETHIYRDFCQSQFKVEMQGQLYFMYSITGILMQSEVRCSFKTTEFSHRYIYSSSKTFSLNIVPFLGRNPKVP